jgi:hypothetical protein
MIENPRTGKGGVGSSKPPSLSSCVLAWISDAIEDLFGFLH